MLKQDRIVTQPTTVVGGQPRTSWTAINNLPLEIFYNIILFAAIQNQVDGYYSRLRSLRLVATSWSALINDYPTCWTLISSSDCEPIWRMALQKSRAADIDVDAGSTYRPGLGQTPLIKAIVGHIPRVRTLRILDRDLQYLITNTSAAPRLRSLCVGGVFGSDDSTAPPVHPAKWAPDLRVVDLQCSRFIWKDPLWNNLKCLRIDTGGFLPGLPMAEIFTILEASPGLRSLDISGIILPGEIPLPAVKLEALETLSFDTTAYGSPVEALNSIVAFPTTRCNVFFDAGGESQIQNTLQSICKIASGITDGGAGRRLKLVGGRQSNRITMGGLEVLLYSRARGILDPLTTLTHLLEGLPPTRCEAVTAVDIHDTESSSVPALLLTIHSFCPNISHLTVPRITKALETALGQPTQGWLFPHLETLSVSRYSNRPRALGIIGPRLRASEAGVPVAKLMNLKLSLTHRKNIDMEEIAELQALVPEVIVEDPVSRASL